MPIESVSPPPSSDDEEAAQRRYDKRLQHLSKARLEKAKRRKEKVMAVSRSKVITIILYNYKCVKISFFKSVAIILYYEAINQQLQRTGITLSAIVNSVLVG